MRNNIKQKDNQRELSPGEKRRRLRKTKLTALSDAIQAYDSTVNLKALDDALKWSEVRTPAENGYTVNDRFSDPFELAERLAGFQAKGETILAAILYSAALPIRGRGPDHAALAQIQEKFGKDVHKLVTQTLRLWSLHHLQLADDAKQSRRDHINLYKLMCLWIGDDPRKIREAILIRGTEYLINMENAKISPNYLDRQQRDTLLSEADHIMAPVEYVAGWKDLSYATRDASYALKAPNQFALTSRAITSMRVDVNHGSEVETTTREVKITEENLEDLKDIVESLLIKKCGLSENQFHIEIRKKTADSANQKAERKGQKVEQLGDRFGLRIILHTNVDEIGNPDLKNGYKLSDFPNLEEYERQGLLDRLGRHCHKVYAILSQEIGRGSRHTLMREQFAKLAARDPHPALPGTDARFDDYVNEPKNEYSAIHDTVFVEIDQKLVEFEMQIVDEFRHWINENAPKTAHFYYKSDLAEYVDIVQAWRDAADLPGVTGAREAGHPQLSYVLIYDDKNQIVVCPNPVTVEDVLDKIYPAYKPFITGVQIDNDDMLADRRTGTVYGLPERLMTGDRVTPVVSGHTYDI